MSNTILKITNLSKTYRKNLIALDNINLTIDEGDFFALLGANGAGKTSLIGIICNLVHCDKGDIEIMGHSIKKNPNEVKKFIGLMPQEFNFNQFEIVEENLLNQAGFYGINKKEAVSRAHKLLKKLDLFQKKTNMIRNLSGGMKRRLMLARAMIHSPKILILDEPTAGVDVELRRIIWNYLMELNKKGVTIILTTHYLEEAQILCKNVAMLSKGKIAEHTSMRKLLAKMGGQQLLLESNKKISSIPASNEFTISIFDDYTIEAELEYTQNISSLITFLLKHNIEITHIENKKNRLESLFL